MPLLLRLAINLEYMTEFEDMINGIVRDAKEQAKAAKKAGRGSRIVSVSGSTISGNKNITINACGSINVNGMSIESSGPVSIVNGTVILPAGASCVVSGSGSIRVATEGADLKGTSSLSVGKITKKTFEITELFTCLVNEAPLDVHFTSGDKVSVIAHGNKAAIDKLNIRVEGGSLVVGLKPGAYSIDDLWVEVTALSLEDFYTSSSGDIIIKSKLCLPYNTCGFRTSGSGDITVPEVKANAFEVVCSGSGNVRIDKAVSNGIIVRVNSSADVSINAIKTTNVMVEVAGSGDVRLSGIAEEVDYSVTGSGDIAAGRLKATTGSAQLMGSGDITANVSGRFTTRCLGSGDIKNIN